MENICIYAWKIILIIHLSDASLYYAQVSRNIWKNLSHYKLDECRTMDKGTGLGVCTCMEVSQYYVRKRLVEKFHKVNLDTCKSQAN